MIQKNKFITITIFILILSLIFTVFFYDEKHWNGLENEENLFFVKFYNRLYFTTTTLSTAGYGDISPKNKNLKLCVIIVQLILIYQVIL
jgi:hypothetical protein